MAGENRFLNEEAKRKLAGMRVWANVEILVGWFSVFTMGLLFLVCMTDAELRRSVMSYFLGFMLLIGILLIVWGSKAKRNVRRMEQICECMDAQSARNTNDLSVKTGIAPNQVQMLVQKMFAAGILKDGMLDIANHRVRFFHEPQTQLQHGVHMNEKSFGKMHSEAISSIFVSAILIPPMLLMTMAFVLSGFEDGTMSAIMVGTFGGFLALCIWLLVHGIRSYLLCRACRGYGVWFAFGGTVGLSALAEAFGEPPERTMRNLEKLTKLGCFPGMMLHREQQWIFLSVETAPMGGVFHDGALHKPRMTEVRAKSIIAVIAGGAGVMLFGFFAVILCSLMLYGDPLEYGSLLVFPLMGIAACGLLLFYGVRNLHMLGRLQEITAWLRSSGTDSLVQLSEDTKLWQNTLLCSFRHMMRQGYFKGLRISLEENRLFFPLAPQPSDAPQALVQCPNCGASVTIDQDSGVCEACGEKIAITS